jgi:hypothetical protein
MELLALPDDGEEDESDEAVDRARDREEPLSEELSSVGDREVLILLTELRALGTALFAAL